MDENISNIHKTKIEFLWIWINFQQNLHLLLALSTLSKHFKHKSLILISLAVRPSALSKQEITLNNTLEFCKRNIVFKMLAESLM